MAALAQSVEHLDVTQEDTGSSPVGRPNPQGSAKSFRMEQQVNNPPSDNYLSLSKVIRRGWTRAMIDKLLGAPDKTATNPMYKSASPMRLYSAKRVLAAEQTDEFAELKSAAGRKSAAMRAVADRKRKEAVTWAKNVDIALPKGITLAVALDRGFKHWRDRKRDIAFERGWMDDDYPPATPDGIDAATRRRWAANWLRHQCSNYERLLIEMYGVVGKDEAYTIVKRRVTERIDNLLGPTSATEDLLRGVEPRFVDPNQTDLPL